MRAYVKGRGSGKTMWAMMESARTGIPILAFSRNHKELIIKMALNFNIDIPEPVTREELNSIGREKIGRVIVDEAQKHLEDMLGVKIYGITMNDDEQTKF